MSKMFVHYSGTVSAFLTAGLEASYANKIVFISGDKAGKGAAIYTHNKYYGDLNELITDIDNINTSIGEMKYFSSVKVGEVEATAAAKDSVLKIAASDPTTVEVNLSKDGINVGLTDAFKTDVANTKSGLASEITRATEAENKIRTDLGQKTDEAKADGSAFARIAQLKADINSMTGGNGSISELINTAISDLDAEKEGASAHVTVKVTEEDGKLTAVSVSESDIASAALLGTAEDAATANTAFGKAAAAKAAADEAKNAATSAEQNAKNYADSLATNYDAAGSAAQALEDAKDYADSLVYDDSALEGRVKANEDAIGVLNGEGEGSVKKQVADAIAGVVASAPEDFDTLKEVADWIGSDTTGAAQMQTDIATLKGDDTTEGSVAKSVKDAIEALDATVGSLTVAEGKHIAVEVVETDGKLTELTVVESDIASKSAVDAEILRAEGAEGALASRLDVIEGEATVEGSIKKAVADAQSALQGSIDTLSGTVAANKTAAETGINEAKGAAASAQSTADANKTAIEAMDLAKVEGFVTSIEQVDGKVSATAVQTIAAEKITITDTADHFDAEVTNVESALAALADRWSWEEL